MFAINYIKFAISMPEAPTIINFEFAWKLANDDEFLCALFEKSADLTSEETLKATHKLLSAFFEETMLLKGAFE